MNEKTFYFYDKVSGEDFFVMAVNAEAAMEKVEGLFDKPICVREVSYEYAEMEGLDTY